jgi:hypothetical protein
LRDGALSELLGAQRPSVFWTPPSAVSSAIDDAREVAASAHIELDEWQDFTLEHGLGEREDGQWASFEVGVDLSRQNGKGGVLEVRELTGIFVLGERTVTHSAHEMGTSLEAQERMLEILEGAPDLEREIQRVSKTNGKEAIYFTGGRKIRYRTRTKSGGRGLGGDLLVIDEDMIVRLAMMGALMPILSARPNPQIWYMGSPVDQAIHEHGLVKAKLRARALAALAGDTEAGDSLTWIEFASVTDAELEQEAIDAGQDPETAPTALERAMQRDFATNPANWARSNPAMGIRITTDYIRNEQRSLDPRAFAVERLGVGDWPKVSIDGETGWDAIDQDDWKACKDVQSKADGHVAFAVDVTLDRKWATIAAAGKTPDGRRHIEVIEHRPGTHWVADRLAQLRKQHSNVGVFADLNGPASALAPEFTNRKIEVTALTTNQHAQACAMIEDALTADERALSHLGTDELTAAAKGAVKRTLGDVWIWSRKHSTAVVSPLTAATIANWGSITNPPAEPWVVVA